MNNKFKVVEFQPPYMILEGATDREDVQKLLWNTSGRVVRGNIKNGIPVYQWDSFRDALRALDGVSLSVDTKAFSALHEYLNAPNVSIDIKDSHFAIKVYEKGEQYRYKIQRLVGIIFDYGSGKNYWKLNLTEAWHLFDDLKDIPNVVYSESAQEYITKALESRNKLDNIAKLEDIELILDLKGHELRSFQKVGVKFMETAECKAILADEMGLGKTWQAIALAMLIMAKKVLVIAPASLKPNWVREIYKLTGETAYVLSGTSPTNHDILKLITQPSRFIVCNYDILARKKTVEKVTVDEDGIKHIDKSDLWHWVEVLKLYNPDLIIVDEAHYIKNPTSQRSQAVRLFSSTAPRIIAMTGTPVLNRPSELWALLNLLHPEQFPAYETFIRQYTYDGKRPRNAEELRKTLKNVMIRRLKKDVVKELPPINRINEYYELSQEAKTQYNLVMSGIYKTLESWGVGVKQTEVNNVLVQIMRLKQICSFDKMEFIAELANEIYDSAEEDDTHKKVLIFSQFIDSAHGIAKRLGHECLWFSGNADPKERQAIVDRFQNEPEIKYLVATTKAASEGLNITAAGTVVFADLMWTPAAHSQAEGRAFGRISDSHSINSYYVIAEKTIEDSIIELLNFKTEVINSTVEGLDKDRDTEASVAMDLIKKIKEEMWTFKPL